MSGPTLQQTQAIGIALPIISTVITLFRLWERIRQRRVWLDDAWVAFSMVLNIVFAVLSYLHLSDYTQYSQAENVAMYYVIVQTFCATVWAARTSILFTVVRLTNPSSGLRRTLMYVFAAFLVTWAILFAQTFWVCESQSGWKSEPRPQCDLGGGVVIARMITDVIADALLIVIPLQLVYKVKLSWPQKIRIISIFSASAITTLVCLVHSYYVLINGGLKESVSAFFEACVSLIVANLSVIVAFALRIGTEEKATFSPKELRSIVTFGSQPARQKKQRDTEIGIESTTIAFDDFGTFSSTKKDIGSGGDVEAHISAEPGQLIDA